MGKHRYAASTQRFADVSTEPAIYAAELLTESGPFLKVGAAGNARGRMMSLRSQVKHDHDAEIGRFLVIPRRTAKAAYETETLVVLRLREIAQPLEGRREFFTGVTFEQVAEVVQEAA